MKRIALGLITLAMAVVLAPPGVWLLPSQVRQYCVTGVDSYSLTGITFDNPGLAFVATLSLMPMHMQDITVSNFNFASAVGTLLFDFTGGGSNIDFTILTLMVVHNAPGSGGFLNVTGTGTLTNTGFDPTLYDWSITSNTTAGVTGYKHYPGPGQRSPRTSISAFARQWAAGCRRAPSSECKEAHFSAGFLTRVNLRDYVREFGTGSACPSWWNGSTYKARWLFQSPFERQTRWRRLSPQASPMMKPKAADTSIHMGKVAIDSLVMRLAPGKAVHGQRGGRSHERSSETSRSGPGCGRVGDRGGWQVVAT